MFHIEFLFSINIGYCVTYCNYYGILLRLKNQLYISFKKVFMNATGYFSTNIIYKQVQFQTVSYILINIQSHLQKLESKLKEIE